MAYPLSNYEGAGDMSDFIDQARGPEGCLKVVAHAKEGTLRYGLCNALATEATSFELMLHNKDGSPMNRRTLIPFSALKALFIVKQFDGSQGDGEPIQVETPKNTEIAIEFEDGEILIGTPTEAGWEAAQRFLVMPSKEKTNNLLVLVERSSVRAISSMDVFMRRQQHDFNGFVKKNFKPGVSQDECLGDYYFSKHDYERALEHYRIARESDVGNTQVMRKICAAKYNIGMRHVKNKDYARALRYMELVLMLDPNHHDALDKAQRLRERLRVKDSLADVHSRLPKCLDSAQLRRFIDCKWVAERHHFVLTGPAGSGKTRLACSLGHKVSKKGMHVAYYRLPNLIEEIHAARQNGSDVKLLRALETVDFLILDDWNQSLLQEEDKKIIREVITVRYLRRATLYIAEFPQHEWHHVFGEHAAADPVLNKVLHDAHKIHLEKDK